MRKVFALSAATVALLAILGGPAPVSSGTAPAAWPPPLASQSHDAFDFVHYGEAHHNEDGGPVVNGEIFRQTNEYGAAFLANSSDLATIGSPAELQSFEDLIDEGFSPLCPTATSATPCSTPLEVPWFHSMGNHDRFPIAGPGGVFSYTNGTYRDVYADQAGPWGTAPVPPGFSGMPRPAGDAGALTHYWVDYGPLRLIAIDNSCHSISTCDALTVNEAANGTRVGQHPPVGAGQEFVSQFQFLEAAARDAKEQGKLVFAMMHEPTRDPRFPLNVDPISVNHTMNKGVSTDNQTFEAIAAAAGVDGVLLAHIKGNNVYDALTVDYYVDGGGGGQPYALDTWSVDFGTYYAYRLFRIVGGEIQHTWLVPVIDHIDLYRGGSPAGGSITLSVGDAIDLDATAIQPRCGHPVFCSDQEIEVELRPPAPPPGFESSVPVPAYVWHTSDGGVLDPVGERAEPGFDPATMSAEGEFVAASPGTATVTVVSGWKQTSVEIVVEP